MESLEVIKTPRMESFRDQLRRNQAKPGPASLYGTLIDEQPEFKKPHEPTSGEKSAFLSFTAEENMTSAHAVHPLLSVVDEFTNQRAAAVAPNSRVEKPRLGDFIQRFESEMQVTELAYKQLVATKKRQHQLYERGLSQVGVVTSNN